jgi:hypothetical protein
MAEDAVQFILHCETCERKTSMIVQGQYWQPKDPADDLSTMWSLLSCEACGDPALISQHASMTGAEITGWTPPYQRFPDDGSNLNGQHIPPALCAAFSEARRCFQNELYTQSAITCRRILDGLAKYHGEGGKPPLAVRLERLRERKVIDQRLHDWATVVLKDLGNLAAHEIDVTISKDDAADALDFTRAILEYVYVYSAAFERFKERQSQRKPVE